VAVRPSPGHASTLPCPAQAHDPGVKLGRFPLRRGSFLMIMGHLPL
jgi:hypothetical protein